MAKNARLYKFNVRSNIRLMTLSNGRQVPISNGYFETTDRTLALMIAEEYKNVITMAVNDGELAPAPIDPIKGSMKSAEAPKPLLNVITDDEEDWGDENDAAGAGANTQATSAEVLGEGAAAATETATPAATKPETAAEKKSREKAEKEAAKAAETK
jgi:hypothetical protein